jgi:hypothetical protein
MRRFLAGKVSVVEDGRMDGYYEESEKYRNKRNYVPLVPLRRFLAGKVSVVEDGRMDGYYEESEKYRNKRNYVPLVPTCCAISLKKLTRGGGDPSSSTS